MRYFNVRGRGELIRLVFEAAGQEYQDARFEREQWPEFKAKSPTGQCPYLEVSDENNTTFILCQTVSIARYLSRKLDLAGKGEKEQAEVDMYADQISDLLNEMVRAHFESDAKRKEELGARLQTEVVPNNMKILEARLGQTGSGYFAASGLTYTDLYLVSVLEWFGDKKEAVLAHFPNVKKLDESVRALPRISAWLARRPVTEM